MEKLTAIYLDLQRVPPEHLYKAHQLVLVLKANKRLVVEAMRILDGTKKLPAKDWAE